MGTPLPPNVNRLMIALQPLSRSTWAGRLPDVAVNEAFWASARDAVWLVADGFAEYAPSGTVAPPAEPRYTAHGQPGFGAGTSNSSH